MTNPDRTQSRRAQVGIFRYVGAVSLTVAILAVLSVLVILFGARFGLWEPIAGFGFYRSYFDLIAYLTAGIASIALVLSIVTKTGRNIALSGLAFVIGAILMSPIVLAQIDPPVRAPPIHNISTDTQNPPEFLVLDDTRPGARNSLQAPDAETAAIQAKAYPDIVPIVTDLSGPDAYTRALGIASDMGWSLVDQQDDSLRFEATARTPVFYFADDIVVVVSPTSDGSRVDLRSVSRIGRGDRGVNAARIRAFTAAFKGTS